MRIEAFLEPVSLGDSVSASPVLLAVGGLAILLLVVRAVQRDRKLSIAADLFLKAYSQMVAPAENRVSTASESKQLDDKSEIQAFDRFCASRDFQKVGDISQDHQTGTTLNRVYWIEDIAALFVVLFHSEHQQVILEIFARNPPDGYLSFHNSDGASLPKFGDRLLAHKMGHGSDPSTFLDAVTSLLPPLRERSPSPSMAQVIDSTNDLAQIKYRYASKNDFCPTMEDLAQLVPNSSLPARATIHGRMRKRTDGKIKAGISK